MRRHNKGSSREDPKDKSAASAALHHPRTRRGLLPCFPALTIPTGEAKGDPEGLMSD